MKSCCVQSSNATSEQQNRFQPRLIACWIRQGNAIPKLFLRR